MCLCMCAGEFICVLVHLDIDMPVSCQPDHSCLICHVGGACCRLFNIHVCVCHTCSRACTLVGVQPWCWEEWQTPHTHSAAQGSVTSLCLWAFPGLAPTGAACIKPLPARSQVFAKSPLSLVTHNLQALMSHQDEVILRWWWGLYPEAAPVL